MSQLRQRVLTAVPLLIGLLLLLFVAPLWLAIAAATALMVLAAWEWSAFIGWQLPAARGGYAAGVALLLAGIGSLVPEVIGLSVVLWVALLWWVAAFLWILRYPTAVPSGVAAAAGLFVLVPAWLAIVAILCIPGRGPALMLLVLGVVFAADIGAY
ncbi:MAG: phosphatidate cytidylyltransferase, partial [Gammaproteobacteria bacterium]|nr:phosphatidate cytidylyltransferase [Gammaproteobacteria bacterium]